MMQVLNIQQGSDAWKEIRQNYLVASEAPVIMGDSPHTKRDELLGMKTTGNEREISEWTERFIFKKGHEYEALARPIAEKLLDDELFALTCTNTVSGLPLLASYDGITAPLYDNHWEHKQYAEKLFELVQSGGELEGKHFWQLEHQLLVNGNDSCIFAVSDGTAENYAEMVYHSRPERREQLIEGWKLFIADLRTFVPVEQTVKATGEVIKDLPALIIDIAGEVKSSNLALYKTNALDFINNIKTDLQTDEDFATAENTVKFCDRVEKELEVVKKQTLGKVVSIDEVMRTIEQLQEAMRTKRLQLEKLVKAEKDNRKNEILLAVKKAFADHIETCNKALANTGTLVRMPDVPVDFLLAAKNKRTIDSLRSACNDELARGKIEANRILSKMDDNLALLRVIAVNHKSLFADVQQLVMKDKDALEAIAKQRISEHDIAEKKRIDDAAQKLADEKIATENKRIADEKAAEDKRIADELEAAKKPAGPVAAEQAETFARIVGGPRPDASSETVVQPATPKAEIAQQPIEDREIPVSVIGRGRPGDDHIINFLADQYQVDAKTVIGWLKAMNLDAAEKRLAA